MALLLHIQLLGGFRVSYDDRLLETLTSPRQQSLLAFLLLHRGTPQSRQHVAFTFWSDSTESRARTNLRKLLYDLRQVLPEPDRFLHADDQTVYWLADGPYTFDVATFESALAESEQAAGDDDARARQALETAVDLYGGDLLPSCYDDWITPERERLRTAYLHALQQLAHLQEQARDIRAAIEHTQRLLRHDPLYEPAYRRLMRLHAAEGDRAGALHVYHTCVTVLERELGVEPSEATQRAHQRLLEAEATFSSPVAIVEEAVPPETAAPPQPAAGWPGLVPSAPLVGRHPEWAQLVAAWERAASGTPHALLVEGEAGIGKSRLASELARWLARQGIQVAAARCYAAEGALPYAPVVAWLRALPLPALEPAWLGELARLLPELLDRHPQLSDPGPMTEPWQRLRLFEALVRAVLGTREPLLLLLDDLQWCDADTREWLHYLLRSNPHAPLLLLGTVRSEELDEAHPIVAWIQALHHDGKVTEVELIRLDEEDTLDLAEHVAAHDLAPELASCIHRETGGNPLYVVEMVRAGLAVDELEPACPLQELPPRIQGAIEARLGQLSQEARALVEVAAVAGRSFSFELLLAAANVGEDSAIVALDELWQRRVVAEQGEVGYDFTHDKLREVAYAGLSPVRRRQLHGRLAQALEALHAGDLDPVAAEIGVHDDRAGQAEQAIPYYLRAGKVARRVYANEEAIEWYTRAWALLAGARTSQADGWRFEALSGLGDAYLWAGEVERAEKHLREAIDVGRRGGVPARTVVRVYHLLGRALAQDERYDEVISAGQEAIRLLGDDDRSVEAALIQATMAAAYRGIGDWKDLMDCVVRAERLVEHLPYSHELGPIYRLIVDVRQKSKHPEKAERWAHMLEQQAASHNDLAALWIAYSYTGDLYGRRGNLSSAVPLLQRALSLCAQIGYVNEQRLNTFNLGLVLLDRGDLEEAEQTARQEPKGGEMLGVARLLGWNYGLLGTVLCAQRKYREATKEASKAVTWARQLGRRDDEAVSGTTLGHIALHQGDPATALMHFQDAARLLVSDLQRHWRYTGRYAYPVVLADVLSGYERAYADPDAFRTACRDLQSTAESTDLGSHLAEHQRGIAHWYLNPAVPSTFAERLLDHRFGRSGDSDRSFTASWKWHDPYADCAFEVRNGLELCAANGRDLWHINLSAPRLTRTLSGDLAIEAAIAAPLPKAPSIGGVLVWVDRNNYLQINAGRRGPGEITFSGCVAGLDAITGRGYLESAEAEAASVPRAESQPGVTHLRLERTGAKVRALCSRDGQVWFTAGEVAFPEGDVEVGVHAIGFIDRTVYPGAHAEGTAIRFASVQVWGC